MKKICVFGAGAVGGNLAVKLAAAQVGEVSIVTRGAHLEAIRDKGLTLRRDGVETTARFAHATDVPGSLPIQDLVIVALKTNSQSSAADDIALIRASGAPVVFIQNGIPWWWEYGLPPTNPSRGVSLDVLDPGRQLRDRVGSEVAIGGVAYSPNEVVSPGVILNRSRSTFILGEPDGSSSTRLAEIHALFNAAGIETTLSDDIRRDLLVKLAYNAAGNPLCALTRLTGGQRLRDPGMRDLSAQVTDEVIAVADAMGWPQDASIDRAKMFDPLRVNDARPSMLQDVLLGRPMEVEALLGQLQVFGHALAVSMPAVDVLLALLRGLDLHLRTATTS